MAKNTVNMAANEEYVSENRLKLGAQKQKALEEEMKKDKENLQRRCKEIMWLKQRSLKRQKLNFRDKGLQHNDKTKQLSQVKLKAEYDARLQKNGGITEGTFRLFGEQVKVNATSNSG